jgi:hypothetical protein
MFGKNTSQQQQPERSKNIRKLLDERQATSTCYCLVYVVCFEIACCGNACGTPTYGRNLWKESIGETGDTEEQDGKERSSHTSNNVEKMNWNVLLSSLSTSYSKGNRAAVHEQVPGVPAMRRRVDASPTIHLYEEGMLSNNPEGGIIVNDSTQ